MEQKTYPKKGQIYFINSDPKHRTTGAEIWSDRLAIIVSNDIGNASSDCVSVVYLTTSIKKRVSPTHIEVISGGKKALALCEQTPPIDKSRIDLIKGFAGKITPSEQKDIDAAIAIAFGITPSAHPTAIFKKWENYINKYNLEIKDENIVTNTTLVNEKDTQEIIKRLTAERDSYKTLYLTNQEKLDKISKMTV